AARAETSARHARELNRGDGGSEAALKALREEHRAADQAQRLSERRTEQLKDELSDLIREAAVIRGRLADWSGERADLQVRLGTLAGELPKITEALECAQSEAEMA